MRRRRSDLTSVQPVKSPRFTFNQKKKIYKLIKIQPRSLDLFEPKNSVNQLGEFLHVNQDIM